MVSPSEDSKPQSEDFKEALKQVIASSKIQEEVVPFAQIEQLNNDLKNMIASDSFNQLTRDVIEIISDAYKAVDERPQKIILNGVELDYRPDLSTSLYSHYENAATIILGIHGANDTQLNRLAITQVINPDIANEDIQQFCSKFRSIISGHSKQVFLFSHSLGFWLTASCKESLSLPFVFGLSIGGFAPNSTSPQIKNIAKSRVFKKILFDNDWLASTILDVEPKHNVLVLRPYSVQSRVYGHGVSAYRTSVEQLNNIRVRFFP